MMTDARLLETENLVRSMIARIDRIESRIEAALADIASMKSSSEFDAVAAMSKRVLEQMERDRGEEGYSRARLVELGVSVEQRSFYEWEVRHRDRLLAVCGEEEKAWRWAWRFMQADEGIDRRLQSENAG